MKTLTLALFLALLPLSAFAQQYPYFCPGGALSANSACSQNVNLAAGTPIQGPLPLTDLPSQASSTILGNNSGSSTTPSALNPLAVANMLQAVISARAVATTNITTSGTVSIDGVSISAGQVVLLTAQTSSVNDGLWLAQAGAWVRPTNFPTGYVIPAFCNLIVAIDRGNAFQGSLWDLSSLFTVAITIGTSNQTWIERELTATPTSFGGVTITVLGATQVPSITAFPNAFADCVAFTDTNGSIGDQGNVSGTTGPCIVGDPNGHPILNATQVAPTVTGTGCSLVAGGTDNRGSVTATGIDACTITFGSAFTVAPLCTVSGYSNTVLPTVNGAPTTAHALVNTAAAGTFSYICL